MSVTGACGRDERFASPLFGFFDFFWTVITPLLELATYTFVFHLTLAFIGRGQWFAQLCALYFAAW